MTTWPVTLPTTPLVAGFSESLMDNILRTEMEAGPAKTRRRTTASVRKMEAQYVLSSAQVATLDGFFTNDVKSGSIAFDFTHPRTSVNVAARFISPPVYQPLNGGYYRVNLSLEILP